MELEESHMLYACCQTALGRYVRMTGQFLFPKQVQSADEDSFQGRLSVLFLETKGFRTHLLVPLCEIPHEVLFVVAA